MIVSCVIPINTLLHLFEILVCSASLVKIDCHCIKQYLDRKLEAKLKTNL
jgi:hypothetical protein